ncbi:ABC transporter substrate-binding protein [Streptomyces sp. NPDC058045]|uniref:ABC transporter substrate-binding protein n=1 Tax=Streptomyces sp. NPDC058045 TaxID=3346311 RepID=UPI0036E6F67C
MRTKTIARLTAVGFVVAATALSACAPQESTGGGSGKRKFTVALARATLTPGQEIYEYAVPKQLGYFAEEDLNVGVVKADGSTAALQVLASRSADAAFASAPNIASAVDKGTPVKGYAGATVVWPYYIGVSSDSKIKRVEDLKGKTIGVISLASASYSDLVATLKSAGLTTKDVEIVPVGTGAPAATALKSGKVDAVDTYVDGFALMEDNGVKVRMLKRPKLMDELFSVTFATRDDELKDKKSRTALTGFTRAAYKGLIYSATHPEEALKMGCKEFPGAFEGCDDPSGKKFKDTLEVLKLDIAGAIPEGEKDPTKWGDWLDIPNDRWESVVTFAEDGEMTKKKIKVSDVWDNSLMKDIYNFDRKKVIEKR